MLKKIAVCYFASILSIFSLGAQEVPRYFIVIDANCNDENDPFQFDGTVLRTGYLTKMAFPSVSKILKADLSLANPENPDAQEMVAAVIDRISWNGGASDTLQIQGRITPQNKAILQEALASLGEESDVEVQLVIYERDLTTKKYFKRLHTFNKPIQMRLDPEMTVYIEEQPDNYRIKKPINYSFNMVLSPHIQKTEEIGFAFSSGGKQFSRPVGGMKEMPSS